MRLSKGDSGEARYLTHEIISRRHRQGVVRIRMNKIIMAIVRLARGGKHMLERMDSNWAIHQPISGANDVPSF